MRLIAVILTFLFSLPLTLLPAAAAEQPLLQRDLMINLVDTLNYSFGLPDSPEDSDYINLLSGLRSYRFEAETYRNPDDLVAINNFVSFGEFSGSGWASALSAPTKMRMEFLLPQSGTYRVYASTRLPGHTLMLEGQSWQIDENNPKFQRIELGEITLSAGMKEMSIAMPANGSIDYIEFIAPPLPAITPLSGWEPNTPLTYTDLAVTTIRALSLLDLLPLQSDRVLFEAEESPQGRPYLTDQRHLGEPHGGLWLRVGAGGGEINLPFIIEAAGVYTLDLIAAGAISLSGTLDNREEWQREFPTYLKEETIGTWFLPAGQHELKIVLPPRGGVDLLTLRKRLSSPEVYPRLAGLPSDGSVRAVDVNRLLTLLARLYRLD